MAVLLFFFLSFFFFVFSCNSDRMCSWVVNLNFVKRWDLPILSSHSTRLLIHSGKMKYLSIGFEALDSRLWIICLAYDDYSTILYEGVFWSSLWSILCFPILILVCVLGSYVLEFACYIEAKSSFQGFQVLMLMFLTCVCLCVCVGEECTLWWHVCTCDCQDSMWESVLSILWDPWIKLRSSDLAYKYLCPPLCQYKLFR